MTELEKMLAGELYFAGDPELVAMRLVARDLTERYNATGEGQKRERAELLGQLFADCGTNVDIQPPFRCDYGCYIKVGDDTFMNFGCVILDCTWVEIGRNCMLAPKVQIYAATHPLDPDLRRRQLENARPVVVEDNVWIGGNAILNPGVRIGSDSVIGSGSVVTRDIPAGVVAAGNPCRTIKRIETGKKKHG